MTAEREELRTLWSKYCDALKLVENEFTHRGDHNRQNRAHNVLKKLVERATAFHDLTYQTRREHGFEWFEYVKDSGCFFRVTESGAVEELLEDDTSASDSNVSMAEEEPAVVSAPRQNSEVPIPDRYEEAQDELTERWANYKTLKESGQVGHAAAARRALLDLFRFGQAVRRQFRPNFRTHTVEGIEYVEFIRKSGDFLAIFRGQPRIQHPTDEERSCIEVQRHSISHRTCRSHGIDRET